MPNPNIEDFMFKKNPQGAPYWTAIEGKKLSQQYIKKELAK